MGLGQKEIGHCSEWLRGCGGVGKEVRPSVCLPPLLWSMVDRIEKGEFVEFTEFSVFDSTRKPGEWGSERVSPTDKEGSPSKDAKKKGPHEVPDVSWWGTYFSLYERVQVQSKLEVAEALCAYRDCVARYD